MKDKQLLALVKRASKQDREAYVELCNLKAREVIYLCTREMQNHHDGEDAAQEVFIRMQKSITSLQAPEAFNVWLNRLVHSTCSNMKRNSMKHKNTIPIDTFDDAQWQDDSEFSLPQEFMEDAEKRRLIAEVIEELPEKYRTPVLLHYYQSLSYAQISEVLGITTDAVNNNMRMARKHMKLELEEKLGTPSASWGILPLMAGAPVLTLSLQEAAIVAVSPAAIAGCLAAAGVGAAATAAGAGAAASSSAGLATKVVLPIAITAALVVGAVGAVVYNLPKEPEAPPSISQPVQAPAVSSSQSTAPDSSQPAAVPAVTSVSGTVFLTGAGGERSGIAGATVELVRVADGAVEQSVQTTDGGLSGGFRFDTVPEGEYKLLVTLPDYAQTGAPQTVEVSIGGSTVFTVPQGGTDAFTGLEVGIGLSTEVSGYLTIHLDDAQLNFEDQTLPGVKVLLLDPDGTLVAETTVARDGTYRFDNPFVTRRGTYTIRVAVDEAVTGEPMEIQERQIELYPGYRG